MSNATKTAACASALLPLWTVTVGYGDGQTMTAPMRASSGVEAIRTLAAILALPAGELTEAHAVRA